MNSREIVTRALAFTRPERMPQYLPEPWGSDFCYVDLDSRFVAQVPGQDEWGCVWEKTKGDRTMGQVKSFPLSSYDDFDTYAWPEYTQDDRYDRLRRDIEQNNGEKYVLINLPSSLNHRGEYLRGFEAFYSDLYEYPLELGRLLDKLTDINIAVIEKLGVIGGVDGTFMCDDWGLQDRLMIAPDAFREFFLPRYARMFRAAKNCGMKSFLHSCGHISSILGDLIDEGLDVIQMDQQQNMGFETLSQFAGQVTFWCPVDIQKTMVTGTPEQIRQYVHDMLDRLGTPDGGFIGGWYASPQAVQHSDEAIRVMCDEFVKYGGMKYKK